MGKVNKKDLRLGNIIGNKDGEPFEVNEDTQARFEQCELLLGKFKAIYMSNKWALKFGYQSLQDMANHFIAKSKYPFEISKRELKKLRVYEAQNLYRFLTGEELKI